MNSLTCKIFLKNTCVAADWAGLWPPGGRFWNYILLLPHVIFKLVLEGLVLSGSVLSLVLGLFHAVSCRD
jgi:hypothetical protein